MAVRAGALQGAEGLVMEVLPKKTYKLRQLNGNTLIQPETRLKYGEYRE